jgi:3-oxoacyl-[acyl-carrier protein] reductase
VTGGAKGIGRGIALAFGREGANVAIIDKDADGARATAKEIEEFGVRASVYRADVSQEHEVTVGLAELERSFGATDVLVNNAGGGRIHPVLDMPTAIWDDTIRLNLYSVFYATRAVLPGMIERRWGRIINISSQLAHKGAPELAAYVAAKAGVIGFTRSLAHEVSRHGVNVNAICPGPIDTDELRAGHTKEWLDRKAGELPIRRLGRVEDIAPTAVLLASEGGCYYVGATLNPNGGDVMT